MKCTCKEWDRQNVSDTNLNWYNIGWRKLKFCPWCGLALPPFKAVRTEWFVTSDKRPTFSTFDERIARDYMHQERQWNETLTLSSVYTVEDTIETKRPHPMDLL